MNQQGSSQPEQLHRLTDQYGPEIELVSDEGTEATFKIVAEFRFGMNVYAGLQTAAMRKADEIAFFRVSEEAQGELSLESIEDEEEWEAAAEAYDELLFASDNMP